MATRTQLKTALFNLLSAAQFPFAVNGSLTWVTTSRRLKLFDALDVSQQPAMFLVQHKEEYQQNNRGTPGVKYLDMGVWCYAPTGIDSVVGDDYLDWMMQGIEDVLVPDQPQTNEVTLGGLCYFCRIERSSNLFIRDPGDIDGQALLVVPIRICMP